MTQALATIQSDLPAFTPEEMNLITSTVAKGATPEELKLFLYRCKVLDLNPLKPGQIHFIKYGNNPGTIVIGIDGFRTRASRSRALRGIKRGVMRDDKSKCVGAWAEVFRSDWQEPARVEVSLEEYSTGKAQWAKMPETMIQKVAEAGALRMAFPDDLGGVYAEEELQKKAEEAPIIAPPRPEEGDGLTTISSDKIEYGKSGYNFTEIPRADLIAEYEERTSRKPKNENEMRHIVKLEEHLAAREDIPGVDFEVEPEPNAVDTCTLCQTVMLPSKYGAGKYCPNYKDISKGQHTRIKV